MLEYRVFVFKQLGKYLMTVIKKVIKQPNSEITAVRNNIQKSE